LLLALPLLAGCGGSGWREYKDPDGKFTVQLPEAPSMKTEPDGWHRLDAVLKGERDLLFNVSYKDFPDGLSKDEFEKRVSYGRDALAEREGNKLLQEKAVTVGKYDGKEFRVHIGVTDDISINRDYAVGNRLYFLTALVPKKWANAPEVAKFLDSFQASE
jgi:hypothetical protein